MGISAIVTAGAAIVGAGTSAYGLYEKSQGDKKAVSAANAQSQASIAQANLSADFANKETGINVAQANYTANVSSQSSAINKNILGLEQGVEAQRKTAMELDAKRSQLEIVRAAQRARSLGLTAATAQGANKGSGLQGGYGQVSGQANTNLLGVQQNLQIGENIFGLNSGITQQNIDLVNLQNQLNQYNASVTTQKSQLYNDYAQQNAALTSQYSAAGANLFAGQSQSAFGSSLFSAGAQLVSLGPTFGNIGGSLFPTQTPTSVGTPASYYKIT